MYRLGVIACAVIAGAAVLLGLIAAAGALFGARDRDHPAGTSGP